MKIKIKKGGLFEIEFKDYFKTHESFKTFIIDGNKFINTEYLEKDIINIYDELLVFDGSFKTSLILPMIIERLKFSYRSAFKVEFWKERGYGIEEFNDWICKRRNVEPVKKMVDGVINKFKYGKFKFEYNGEPVCNLCKSKLDFDILIDTYVINKCENDNCASHDNKEIKTIRQLAFLPKEIFKKKNNKINIDFKSKKEYWLLKGFSVSETNEKVCEIKNKLKGIHQNTKEFYKIVTDMSDSEIDLLFKKNSHLSPEYWINKNIDSDVYKKNISEYQKKVSNEFAEKRKENPATYSAVTTTQIGYWIKKGFSESDAKQKILERQTTFSLDICIEKHGKEKGRKKWSKRQEKWTKTLNDGGNLKIGYSKISQELFDNLINYYVTGKEKVFYATKNGEYRMKRDEGSVWVYDFVDLNKMKIIEYNGDQYHGNPEKYLAEDYPHPFRKNITAKEMWDKDKRKTENAIKKGFEVLVVWDSEYRWGNKQKVIDKCLKFLEL